MSVEENEDLKNSMVLVEGEEVSLADLAGIDLDKVLEKWAGEAFPKGTFIWEVESDPSPGLVVIGEKDGKGKAAAGFQMKCLEVVEVSDPDFKAEVSSLIGKTHRETFLIGVNTTITDSLGYIKAFLNDIGAPEVRDLNARLKASAGCRFQASISKRKDKNDTDKVYTSLNRSKGKIKKIAETSADVAARSVA